MTPYQEHLTFMRGWADGAGRRPMSEAYTPLYMAEPSKIYEAGYVSGQRAWRKADDEDSEMRRVKLNKVIAES